MAPELVGAQGVIDAHVEAVLRVTRPTKTVGDVNQRVLNGLLAIEWSKGHGVEFVTVEVDADGQPSVVGGDGHNADGQEVVTLGLEVFVEENLLGGRRGQRIDGRRGQVGTIDGHATGDGVVQPLEGALVVPPAATTNGHGDVGLFNTGFELGEDLLAQTSLVGQ